MADTASSGLHGRFDRTLLLVLLAAAVVVAAALVLCPRAPQFFNDKKAWELTTQFFLVAVVGGAVGLAYRYWEARRADERRHIDQENERRAVQRAALQQFYRSAVTLHHEYKKIRRTLRSLTIRGPDGLFIERGAFEQLMDKLEDCQLRVENMSREVESQKDLFASEHAKLSGSLSKVENYLRKLLRDYENGYENRRKVDPRDLISVDRGLADFVARSKQSRKISTELFEPAEDVRKSALILIERTTPDATKPA